MAPWYLGSFFIINIIFKFTTKFRSVYWTKSWVLRWFILMINRNIQTRSKEKCFLQIFAKRCKSTLIYNKYNLTSSIAYPKLFVIGAIFYFNYTKIYSKLLNHIAFCTVSVHNVSFTGIRLKWHLLYAPDCWPTVWTFTLQFNVMRENPLSKYSL